MYNVKYFNAKTLLYIKYCDKIVMFRIKNKIFYGNAGAKDLLGNLLYVCINI